MKSALALLAVLFASLAVARAQLPPELQPGQPPGGTAGHFEERPDLDLATQLEPLFHAGLSLPIAGVLGAALAFRPRRRGTPPRKPAVIQTQIILALVGAVVMLVIGSSLARAFGIVGAASLVRYRAKIDDPKDAGVMLSCLAIGLAAGVGLYVLAAFATGIILGVLWLIESLEPESVRTFTLRVKAPDPGALRASTESLLRRNRVSFELRTMSGEELCYEVTMPFNRRTDRLAHAIVRLAPQNAASVEWEEKKNKQAGG